MELEDVRRALVVGAGAMGHGIAIVYAISGRVVDLVDHEETALGRARDRILATLKTLADAGVIPESDVSTIAGRITTTTDLDAVAPLADIATEAIVEDRSAKKALLIRLDGLLRPGTLIASNTSGLDVFSLVEDAIPSRLDRLIIHHYFLPAPIVPLVEVVAGPRTSRETVEFSVRLLESLGRATVVLDRFRENFLVNSFQIALGLTAARLLADGIASPEQIDRAVKYSLGVRLPIVGIAQSLDFTGLDLFARMLRHVGEDASYFEGLVSEGRAGVKDGRGMYNYGGRPLAEIEAERDRKYLEHLRGLRELNAFDRI